MPYPILSLGASVYVSWIFGKIDESDDIRRLVHLSVSSWAVGCVNCTAIKLTLEIFACTVKGRLLVGSQLSKLCGDTPILNYTIVERSNC